MTLTLFSGKDAEGPLVDLHFHWILLNYGRLVNKEGF